MFDFVPAYYIIQNIFNSSFTSTRLWSTYVLRRKIEKVPILTAERIRLIPRLVLTFKLFKSCQPLYYLRGMIHPGANSRICTTGITAHIVYPNRRCISRMKKSRVKSCARFVVVFKLVVVIYLRLFVFHAKLQWFSSLFLSPC